MLLSAGLFLAYVAAGSLASYVISFLIRCGGAPGAFIGQRQRNQPGNSIPLFSILLSAVGQCYVALGYCAVVVSFTRILLERNQQLISWVLWIAAFLAVCLAFAESKSEQRILLDRAKNDNAEFTFQSGKLGADIVTLGGFFLFIFYPASMTPWKWLPFV